MQAEAAVARDPLFYRSRIKLPKCPRRRVIDDLKAKKASTPGGMEAEHRVGGDANPVMRNDAEHHGTGGRALAIDDDLLAAGLQRHVARPVIADLASFVVGYSHSGRRGSWRRAEKEGDEAKDSN